MKLRRRAFVFAVLAAMVPLAILAACGSSDFSANDQDADIVTPGDGGVPDSTILGDANADVDAAPLPPTWCQTNQPNAFFCADFDEGDLTLAYDRGTLKAMMTVQEDGGMPGDSVTLGDGGKSPPANLLTFAPAFSTTGGVEEYAAVKTALADAPGTAVFQLDFELRIDLVGNLASFAPTLTLNDLTEPGTTNFYDLELTNDTKFGDSVLINTSIGPRPTVGLWTHFRFVIFPGGGTLVSMGNGALVDGGPSKILTTTTLPTLVVGQDVTQLAPNGGSQISFDNIVLATIYPDAGDGG